MGDSVQADCWQRPQFSTTSVLKDAYFLFGMYRSKTLTMELDCHVTAHFALPAWCLAKAIKYVLLYSVSDQNLHLGHSIFHIRRCSLLQDFNTWFHRVQTFFPNDTEPPPHSTSGSTHMKTDSCLTLHVFTRLLNSTQPLCRAFLFIAYNPLSASSLHPSYHGDLLPSGPFKQHHCSWWQPIPCVQLLSHPGGLSFIDPSSHLGLLLHLVVTSIF